MAPEADSNTHRGGPERISVDRSSSVPHRCAASETPPCLFRRQDLGDLGCLSPSISLPSASIGPAGTSAVPAWITLANLSPIDRFVWQLLRYVF